MFKSLKNQKGFVGSLISAGASLIGGAMGSDAAGDAAAVQAQSAAAANAEIKRQFDLVSADFAPWIQAGQMSLQDLSSLIGISTPGGGDRRNRRPDTLTPDAAVYRGGYNAIDPDRRTRR